MPFSKENTYTTDYIYSLPEGQRAELIDGVIYDMAPPNRLHQELVSELHYKITDYIKKNNGACKVFPAPFAPNNPHTPVVNVRLTSSTAVLSLNCLLMCSIFNSIGVLLSLKQKTVLVQ